MSHKEFERSIKIREFQDDLRVLLVEEDREYIQYALKEFSTYKNVRVLVEALLSCLKTPETLDLLPVIRELLPKRNQKEYDRFAPYHKMAHPVQRLKHKKGALKHLQTIWLERSGRLPLGFSIRGGKEMGLGIYVSEVDPGSLSDEAGLRVGDQIIEVNGINFEWLSHSSAVKVFKAFTELEMVTYNSGRLPKFEETGEAFCWIDPLGNPVEDTQFEDPAARNMADQLFSSSDKRKVVIKKKPGRSVGLKIRGGKEFKLGIFVVSIDAGSLAEDQGLNVGDQILMVNGITFRNILHEEAVSVLKSNDILMMSVQCVGRIPQLKSQYKKNGRLVNHTAKQEKSTDKSEPRRFSFKDGLTDSPKFKGKDKKGKKTTVSPLSTMERRPSGVPMGAREETSSSDNISIDDDDNNGSSKFQYGIGTGMMLSTTAHNPVKEQIVDKANKLLNDDDEVATLERKLAEYEEKSQDINGLIDFLVVMLDTPEKLNLLADIRCALKPHDLAKFDKQMSVHELKAKKKRRKKNSGEDEEEDIPEPSPVVLRPKKKTKKGVRRDSKAEKDTEISETKIRRPSASSTKEPPMEPAKAPRDFEAIRQNIVVKASQVIKNMAELKSIDRRLKEYGANGDLDFLVRFLLTMLDTPKKQALLVAIRELIKESQRDAYDGKVVQYLPKDQSEGTSTVENKMEKKPAEKPVEDPVVAKKPSKDVDAIKQKIQAEASKVLKIKGELKGLDRRFNQYVANGDIEFLVNYLLTIFDTPKKCPVLADIREIIEEKDLPKYDELTSQFWKANEQPTPKKTEEQSLPSTPKKTEEQPLTSTPKKTEESSSVKKDNKTEQEVPKPISIPPPPPKPTSSKPVAADPSSIANEIKNRGGATGLRKVEVKKDDESNDDGNSKGPFTDPAAQEVLHKAKSNSKLTEKTVPQTRESFLAWNDDFSHSQGHPKIIISPGKPLHLEIEKTAFFLGIELKEGEKAELMIDDILEDGAAFNDGFLTPGFKVLKVDDKDLAGLTVGDAEALLNEKYDSDKASINLIVVSPPN